MSHLHLPRPETGVLFVVSGPSGVGKSTLIRHALDTVPGLSFSTSATTRAPREGEVDGREYFFLDRETFEQRARQGDFLEHAEVYGTRYGTFARVVEEALDAGRSLLLDIDVQGAAAVRERMADAVTIFILPPSREALEQRLRGRAQDSEQVIARRLSDADVQLGAVAPTDHLVVNDDLDSAKQVFVGVMLAALAQPGRHEALVRTWAHPAHP